MNQIAIGYSSNWVVLDGQAVSPPFKRAALFSVFNSEPLVDEFIEIQLAGTPAQVSAAITSLELISYRAKEYEHAAFPTPQYLRVQHTSGGSYFYSPITNIFLAANPAGYKTHQTGSILIELHYTRSNYFDGPQVELPLSGRAGTDLTGGYTVKNHTDSDAAHGNSVFVKPAHFVTDLPAPLRLELTNTSAASVVKDFYIGAYHHPTNTGESCFFYNTADITGGAITANGGAIDGYYKTFTWSTTPWTGICSISISLTNVNLLDGRTYRPLMHFFSSHAYSDLYLRLQLIRGSNVLYTGEPVYCPANTGHVLFPPIEIPPNQLLREVYPHNVDIVVQALKTSTAAYSLQADQLQLFPLDYAAIFNGFFETTQNDIFIDDNFRGLTNVRFSAAGSETVAHVRQGGSLLLFPNSYTRLFFSFVSAYRNTIYIGYNQTLKAFYRKRIRVL